jgi:hypothetical protein
VWAKFKVSSVKPGGKCIDYKALNVQKRNGVSWQNPELLLSTCCSPWYIQLAFAL